MHTYLKVVHLHIYVSHGHEFSLRSDAKHLFASQDAVQNSTGKEMFAWWGWVGSSRFGQWVEGYCNISSLNGSVNMWFQTETGSYNLQCLNHHDLCFD